MLYSGLSVGVACFDLIYLTCFRYNVADLLYFGQCLTSVNLRAARLQSANLVVMSPVAIFNLIDLFVLTDLFLVLSDL